MDLEQLPSSWRAVLAGELEKPYFKDLSRFVDEERRAHEVFPPEREVFSAFALTPFDRVRVLLLGQDPYHDNGQAHGLCFSVKPGVKPPPSLRNMYKELQTDIPGFTPPAHGFLQRWAEQGILLLNAVLTVRAHAPASHAGHGWETFTDAVIGKLNARPAPLVFCLWGGYAQKKKKLITAPQHITLQAAHPSPLSAKKFFGSRPFSRINEALASLGQPPIDWHLPRDPE
ncbi:MAG: uracil-DNA glycosylase [Polyangiaceae bacterium]